MRTSTSLLSRALRSILSLSAQNGIRALCLFFAIASFQVTSAQVDLELECPEDIEISCEDDLDPANTGEISFNDSCLGGELEADVSYSDETISADGCTEVIERTFTISACGVEEECTQTITIIDDVGPVFPEVEDITVACIGDVPEQEELEATDECSVQMLPGPFFQSEIGNPVDSCVLTIAEGLGPDWSLWLPTISDEGLAASAHYDWVDQGTLVTYADGSARITGTVVNMNNPDEGFEVDMWFQNGMNWDEWSALGRSYKDDAGLAGDNYLDWTYYELVDGVSTLTGTGDLAGSSLNLYHAPDSYYFGFQCGLGANNKNANEGMSGWFTYTGTVNGESIEGAGDINVDKECFTPNDQQECVHDNEFVYVWIAEDGCGNVTMQEQYIYVNDSIAPEFTVVPEDVTVECDEELPAVFEGVEAVDNCSGDVNVVYSGETVNGEGCEYTVTRTWIATDECGNDAIYEQTITVVDTTAPEFTFVPEDANYQCSDDFELEMATATDNCSENVSVTVEESVEGDECYSEITRVFTADDGCGNISTATQLIVIEDTEGPVFEEFEVSITAECGETDDLILTATDNCSEEVDVTYEETLQSGGCVGVIVRNYTAVDGCGNETTATQYITLTDTEAPEFEGVPENMTVECDELPEVPEVSAIDNCEGEVDIEWSEEIIEGDCPENYTIVWTWTATDLCENSASVSTEITVEDTTDPEFVDFPEDMTVECDEELGEPVFPSATDNCDEDVEIELTEVEEPGDCPNSYTILRTFRGFDNCGNEVMQVQTINVVDTTAPEFTSVPENVTIECDEEVPSMMAEATDNCGAVTVTSSDEVAQDEECPQASTITRTFSAEDECGNVTTATQVISIVDTTAPVIEGTIELDMPCDMVDESIMVEATDNCGEVSISFEDTPVSGGCAGKIIRDYVAVDECGNTSEFQQIITLVDDVAPTFDSFPEDVTVECGEVPSNEGLEVEFSDNCTEVELEYNGEEIIDGDCPQNYTIERTWTLTDECDNTTTATWTITVEDTTAPVFEVVPADVTVECDQELPTDEATAFDNCGEVSITSADEIADGECPQEYTVTRTFTATDECGNASTAVQTISVVDTTAPEFTSVPEDVTIECDEEVPSMMAEANDNCGAVTISSSDESVAGECPQESVITRTYTATDECGNASTATQVITIVDTTAPEIEGEIEITMPCDDVEEGIFITATDNCGEVDITYEDTNVSGGCVGHIIRDYVVTDGCGNTAEFQQSILLTDEEAPVFTLFPEDVTVECDDVPSADGVELDYTDNCTEVTLTYEGENIIEGDCEGQYTIEHTWTIMDNCENSTSATWTVNVEDTTAPAFEVVPEDVTIECDQDLPTDEATAFDNCGEVTITSEDVITDGDCPQEYVVTRTFTATDDCGNASTAVQTITVVDTTAPEFTSVPEDVTFECDEEVPSMMAEASDNCGVVTVTSSDESVAGQCPQESVITRTFTATDECGNASTATQVITIVDTTAPVFDEYDAELEMACDDVMETSLTATDNCGEVEVTMVEDFDAETGCIGTITRTFTAVDECGNTATAVQVITLTDDVAPVFDSFPEDVTVECDQVPSNEGLDVVYSDNCSEVILEYNGEEIIEGDCANNYTIERSWTITDSCGNSTTAVWTINVEDTTAPIFEFVPEDITYNCEEGIEYGQAIAFDNCSEVSIETAVDTVAGDCPNNFEIVRTFTATDACGNTTVDSQTITVVDETAPVFTSVPQGNELSCEEELPTEMAMATDNCGEVVVTFNDSIVEGDCPNDYQVIRMWTATDECGNSASAETNYYIYDFTAPEFDGEVEDVMVQCADDVPAIADITATDNCGTATVTSSTEVLDEDECGNSVSIVTLVAADECGNTTEISYTVTVEDTTAPELIDAPEDLVLDCEDEVPSAPEVTAVDNCDDDVEVTYTEEFVGDAPAEGSVDDCRTYNPQGVSPAWSLWLQDFENGLDYYELPEGQTGNWVTYPDGSAHLTGTVYSTSQPNRGFEIDVWFENGMDWDSWSSQPFPTSYKDDNGFAEDDMLYEDWTYYIMNSDSATLTGVGDYAGSFLNLSHAPSNLYFGFQEGQAADNRTPDYGIGGWFYYDGFLNGPSFEGEVSGAGDFAFGLDCCPEYEIVRTWTAVDCSGNVTSVSQTISFEDLEEDDPAQDPALEDSAYDAEKGEIHIGGLAPNPSRNMTYVEYTTKSSQRVVIEVFDLTGHRLDQQSQGVSKAGETYSKQINTSDLESGIYLVKVRSDKGAQTIRLVVSK